MRKKKGLPQKINLSPFSAFIQEVNKRFKIDARIKEPGRPRNIAGEEGKNENK